MALLLYVNSATGEERLMFSDEVQKLSDAESWTALPPENIETVAAVRSNNGQYQYLESRKEKSKAVGRSIKKAQTEREHRAYEKHIKEKS